MYPPLRRGFAGLGDVAPAGAFRQDQGAVFYNTTPQCQAFAPDWPTAHTIGEVLDADPLKNTGSTWTGGPPLQRGFDALGYTAAQRACVVATLPSWSQAYQDYTTWLANGANPGTPGTFTPPIYTQSNQNQQTQDIINAAIGGNLATDMQQAAANAIAAGSASGSQQQSTLPGTSWFTDAMIPGVPNWMLAGGAAVAVLFLVGGKN